VDRLEEFKPAQFERAGGQYVVQYRGELLPIANLSDKSDLATARDGEDTCNVLVCSHQGRRMGIVVDQILDVADENVAIESRWKDSHSSGSAVVQNQVTDFLDLETILGIASESGYSLTAETVAQ
jgi:two-component system chemotaxis sensor kinase CheA